MLNPRILAVPALIIAMTATTTVSAQESLAEQHRRCAQELDQVSDALGYAFASRDLDTFMAAFLDDAVQVNTLGQVFAGKAQVESFYRAVMASDYRFSFVPVSKKVNQCSTAVVVDHVEFSIPSAGITLQAIDVATWVRVEGRWRLQADTTTRIATPAGT